MTNYEAGLAQGRAEGADAVRKLNQKLADMTADRDEWRQQHENLLAMYQAEVAKRGAAQETRPARKCLKCEKPLPDHWSFSICNTGPQG